MSSKLLAILTVLVIGIVSFLIGKFLTSSKWKNKSLHADAQNKLLEKRKASVEASLKEAKEKEQGARKKNTEHLAANRSKDQTIKELEKRVSKKANAVTHTDESYNGVLNALNAEKKKVINLEAQLVKKAISASSNKKISTSTFKSFDNVQLGTQKVLDAKPKHTGLLASVLERMSMFNNLGEIDDLTKVNGINATISNKLKKEGIHNYKQVAMLEKKDLPIVAKVAGIDPAQIVSLNWVGAARSLYHKKYKVGL